MTRYLEYMNQVCSAWERGDMPAARAAVDAALGEAQAWPERGHALHAAGLVYGMLGHTNESIHYWEQFIHGAGEGGNGVRMAKVCGGLSNYGLRLREAGRISESITAYQLAINGLRDGSDNPVLLTSLQNVAWALCLADDAVAAEAALNEAEALLSTDSDRANQQIGRAFVAVMCDNHDAAMAICHRLMASQGTPLEIQAQCYWLMGQIFMQQGMLAAAAECVRHGLTLAADADARMTADDLRAMEQRLSAQAS